MLRHCTRLVSLLALAVTGPFLASHAAAQARPHLANGVAQFAANQSDFTGSGQATHLGRYREIGNVVFTPTAVVGVFVVTGWSHYEAADGDVLHAVIGGTVDFTTGAIAATATYTGGTGRFANASGASVLTGQLLAGGALAVRAVGTLDW